MVKLITVATHTDGYLPWLEKSCERYNVNLVKLGFGQKWLGFSWRFKLIIDYLENINPNELVVFIDAYDVLLLRPLDNIEEYYNYIIKMTGKKIIVSKDKNINSFIDFLSKIYFGTCNSFRICAGSYMGKAKDILDFLNKINKNINDDDDDQQLFTKYFKNNLNEIYIDTDNIFFLVRCHLLKDILEYKNIKIKNRKLTYLNSKPFFIHGNSNTLMHNLILKLGYKISNEEIKNTILKNKNNYENKLKKYYLNQCIKKFKYYIIFIIFIIIFIITKFKF